MTLEENNRCRQMQFQQFLAESENKQNIQIKVARIMVLNLGCYKESLLHMTHLCKVLDPEFQQFCNIEFLTNALLEVNAHNNIKKHIKRHNNVWNGYCQSKYIYELNKIYLNNTPYRFSLKFLISKVKLIFKSKQLLGLPTVIMTLLISLNAPLDGSARSNIRTESRPGMPCYSSPEKISQLSLSII